MKAVIAYLKTNVHDHSLYRVKLGELRKLVEALGYEVSRVFLQTRISPRSSTLFGRGKIEEIKEFIKSEKIDAVVTYNVLSSKQKYNLEKLLGREIVDRYELTLKIFSKMASDKLSKLQIELASLRKLFPYYKLQASQKYLRERPGYMAGGEYIYHNVLTGIRRREKRVLRNIEMYKKRKIELIKKRKKLGVKAVCLVGYYNAGKTSLFNAITKADKEVSLHPFTTLSSKSAFRYMNGKNMLFIDTIGFVVDFDPKLISSFEINLLDMKESELLLQVIDVSDPVGIIKLKHETTLEILKETVGKEPMILTVCNKIDLLPRKELEKKKEEISEVIGIDEPLFVSALTREKLNELLEKIYNFFWVK